MSDSFRVYIDEPGDEGFVFDKGTGKGSSHWFVLSGIITRSQNDLAVVKLVDEVRRVLGKPEKTPLHFRRLKHEHRIPFIEEISVAKLRAIVILIHKPSIREPEKFQRRHVLYHYAARYLLESVSKWRRWQLAASA